MEIRNPRQIGLLVTSARKARAMTQAQLAKRAGISRQLVNRLEMGNASGMALGRVLDVLAALDATMSVDYAGAAGDSETALVPPRDDTTNTSRQSMPPIDLPRVDESLFAPTTLRGDA